MCEVACQIHYSGEKTLPTLTQTSRFIIFPARKVLDSAAVEAGLPIPCEQAGRAIMITGPPFKHGFAKRGSICKLQAVHFLVFETHLLALKCASDNALTLFLVVIIAFVWMTDSDYQPRLIDESKKPKLTISYQYFFLEGSHRWTREGWNGEKGLFTGTIE